MSPEKNMIVVPKKKELMVDRADGESEEVLEVRTQMVDTEFK